MTCPNCKGQTQPTYEGPQRWCRRCGSLSWINADGTVRRYVVPMLIQQPEVPLTTQQNSRRDSL